MKPRGCLFFTLCLKVICSSFCFINHKSILHSCSRRGKIMSFFVRDIFEPFMNSFEIYELKRYFLELFVLIWPLLVKMEYKWKIQSNYLNISLTYSQELKGKNRNLRTLPYPLINSDHCASCISTVCNETLYRFLYIIYVGENWWLIALQKFSLV